MVLHQEDEAQECLVLKARGLCLQESQGDVGNRDFTLKGCVQNLTCSEMQGRSGSLKRSLGGTHMLILEGPLQSQEASRIHPGDVDTGGSNFGELIL